jgi:hypothetical protein
MHSDWFSGIEILQGKREKHGKASVRVRKTSVMLRKPQSKYSIHITKNTHTLQNPHKHTDTSR